MRAFSLMLLLVLVIILESCTINPPTRRKQKQLTGNFSNLPLDQIQLPKGFQISLFAEDVENARSLEYSPNGTLFVSTRGKGDVYALRDTNKDYHADEKYVLATGLTLPNGVAFKDGDLYVAEVNRILKFENIEANLASPPMPIVIFDGYPDKRHHGWKYIAFGPDGKLYVPVGAPCNICTSEERIFNTITRINPDGTGLEIVQEGIRNTVGFTWHPETGELWFTDNGGDNLGDDLPACELNHAVTDGLNFGFPYCHQGDFADPTYGDERDCGEFVPPTQKLGAHVAPLGLEFYTGTQFPAKYRNQVFIAEHGSWNRTKKSGYRISMVTLEDGKATSYKGFAEGWLNEKTDDVWGRPVDLEQLPDGSFLISDDFANAIYRISYMP